MEMVNTLALMLFASTLVFLPKMEAQPYTHPLCVSQFALVNSACAMLPYIPLPLLIPPFPPLPLAPSLDEVNRHGHDHSPSDNHGHDHSSSDNHGHGHEEWPGQGHGDDLGHELEHGHNYSHGHGQGQGQGQGHGHGQEHRHAHRHKHKHRHESAVKEKCCRWLNELDDECVCDLLVRLPPFLSRPLHTFNVYLDETCNVTYACEGRLLRS
ncbi:kininogen-1 [Manihot esculenta]|uniref:Bifunctional inhibitor/plant lipid transfer protein/seed storage helical domain-containing protein n=1 Tax=Manihot esculenta TaxID=3983 RepID=A0A2C9VWC5_MANES|nr:kininogen-1 [Manihot esculenta]OAY49673.1 hypothetical protein MANES_05G074000v8 [Manihot esculenta]